MTRGGRFRGSTAQTFLAEARRRTNLRVVTKAVATHLSFDGQRCTGVAFRQNGRDSQVSAAREVIVCGGTVNSPHLLQISGIGPAGHLRAIGVRGGARIAGGRRQPAPTIIAARVTHRVNGEVSINQLARGARLVARDRPLCRDRPGCADLWRHQRDGVLPQPRGARKPGPAIAVYARQLRPECGSAGWSASPA